MSARDEALRLARDARERAAKATPPPWTQEAGVEDDDGDQRWHVAAGFVGLAFGMDHDDSEFVAHARDDVPELCDLVDSLVRENEELTDRGVATVKATGEMWKEAYVRQRDELNAARAENETLRAELRLQRRDLTAWHGLFAYDGAAPKETWEIDTSRAVGRIDALPGDAEGFGRGEEPEEVADEEPLWNREAVVNAPALRREIERLAEEQREIVRLLPPGEDHFGIHSHAHTLKAFAYERVLGMLPPEKEGEG